MAVDLKFVIPVKPRTKKNHQQMIRAGGRFIPTSSKPYQQYEKDSLMVIPSWARQKISTPVNIKALYYVDSRRKVDKTNLESALMDVLVKAGVLADDSAINPEIVVGTDGSRVYVDKVNPRTEVEITDIQGWEAK